VEKLVRNIDAPSSNKRKEKSQDDIGRNPTPRRYVDDVKDARGNKFDQRISRHNDFRSTSRQSPSSKYQSIFFGYFYSCTNFGYMAKACKAYHKDKYNGPLQSPRSNFERRSHASSSMYKMECFNFHKIEHVARDCNMNWVPIQVKTMTTKPEKKITQVWRIKQIGSKSVLNTQDINSCC